MKTTDAVIVYDFGTSKLHTNLIEIEKGSLLYGCTYTYIWNRPRPGWSEHNPEQIWGAMQQCTRKLLKEAPKNVRYCAISFSYCGDNFIPVDENGNELYPMILSLDLRATDEAEEIRKEIGENTHIAITGSPIRPDWCSSKMLWFNRHREELAKKTAGFFTIQQFINSRLGFEPVSDLTLGCRTMLVDIQKRDWSQPLARRCLEEHQKLQPLADASTILGKIGRIGEVRLPYEIPVILGGHDCMCAFLGLGVKDREKTVLANVTGTFHHIGTFVPHYVNEYQQTGIVSFCGLYKADWALMVSAVSGHNLNWFLHCFCAEHEEKEQDKRLREFLSNAEFDGRNTLMMLRGVQTEKGIFTGFTPETTKQNMFDAILESVLYELCQAEAALEKIGGKKFDIVHVGGVAAHNKKQLQLKADMFGIPVCAGENPEIPSLGAAMLAADALKVYRDVSEAGKEMIRTGDVIYPNAERAKRYKENLKCWLYDTREAAREGVQRCRKKP